MDDIPDHCIKAPFGTSSPQRQKQTDIFNRYINYIIPVYKQIYQKYMCSSRGFECSICKKYIHSSKSAAILAHLGSIKCLRVHLGDKLQEQDKCKTRRVVSNHIVDASGGVIT